MPHRQQNIETHKCKTVFSKFSISLTTLTNLNNFMTNIFALSITISPYYKCLASHNFSL